MRFSSVAKKRFMHFAGVCSVLEVLVKMVKLKMHAYALPQSAKYYRVCIVSEKKLICAKYHIHKLIALNAPEKTEISKHTSRSFDVYSI